MLPFGAMAIRSLCITEGADRPTLATFIGMHKAGIEIAVVCPASHRNFEALRAAGIPVIDIPLRNNFDMAGTARLREELRRGRYHLIHTFSSRALTNGLRASKGLSLKVIAYRGIVGNVEKTDIAGVISCRCARPSCACRRRGR